MRTCAWVRACERVRELCVYVAEVQYVHTLTSHTPDGPAQQLRRALPAMVLTPTHMRTCKHDYLPNVDALLV